MELKLDFRWIISFLLMCFVAAAFGQEMGNKTSIGDEIYREYKEKGIDQALTRYHSLKATEANRYNFDEYELNRIGYQLMIEDGDLTAAEKIFRTNMEEYPDAANPRDSYADYLIEKGDTEEAKKYLQESVSLAEKSNKENEKSILRGSVAKLAKLENKDKQLDFLVGNWEVNSTNFNEGLGSGSYRGTDEYVRDEEGTLITINHKNERGDVMAKRIMVYDAVEDEFDMAYISTTAPLGIRTSTLKLKDLGNNKYELIEEYENFEGEKKKAKHELIKNSDGKLDWVIYEPDGNNQDWKKVFAMDMSKRN